MSGSGREASRDPHRFVEDWLVDGARHDLPRDLAVHASLCVGCRTRIAAFDMLSAVQLERAGFPPLRAGSIAHRARGRMAVAAGSVVAVTAVAAVAASGWRLPVNGPANIPAEAPTQEVLGNTGEPQATPTAVPSSTTTPSASATTEASTLPSSSAEVLLPSQPPIIAPSASPRPSATPAVTPRPSIIAPTPTTAPTPEVTPEPPTPSPEPTIGPTPIGASSALAGL